MRTKVRDVMTSPVVTIGAKTGFKAIVERLRARAISAVPVVDAAGRVVGVVSEADLLLKEERAELEEHQPFLAGPRTRRARTRAAAGTAGELMSCPAATIRAESVVADLIVTGSRGRGELVELLGGSVSQRVVHHAHCPVVVVPPVRVGRVLAPAEATA